MRDAIAVLNAGSSSIKFSLFAEGADDLELTLRGQAEALQTKPSFVAKSAHGDRLATHAWPEGTPLGHADALEHIVAFLRENMQGLSLKGIGHRVVEDDKVLQGGCTIESAGGQIDAQIQTRWRRVVENLSREGAEFDEESVARAKE